MPDGRKNNGGNKNAGRKPKVEEQKLIEKLSPLDQVAFKALKNALVDSEGWAVKLYMEYRFGKPRQQIDHTTDGEKINMPIMTWVTTNED